MTGGSGYVGRNLIRELIGRGVPVRALGRSDEALAVVTGLGAEGVRGDLFDRDALIAGMTGCDTVFHSAAFVDDWDPKGVAERINVDGTRAVLEAARAAGVAVTVHVSTEAVLVGGPQMVRADETWPLPEHPIGCYPRTKGMAERVVREAAAAGQRVVIVRPRYIWGNDDTTLLPRIVEAVQMGLLRWFGGGRYLTSTCHVDNCVEGMILAAERGRGGEAYFLTDGEPVEFRGFMEQMLRTQGVTPPKGSIPLWALRAAAWALEAAYVLPLPGRPPITRSSVRIVAMECTVVDRKARAELGYVGHRTIAEGMADLEARRSG